MSEAFLGTIFLRTGKKNFLVWGLFLKSFFKYLIFMLDDSEIKGNFYYEKLDITSVTMSQKGQSFIPR